MDFHCGMPTYEELKALPKDKEYEFSLLKSAGSGYYRVTYNEYNSGKISLDYMEDKVLHYDYTSGEDYGIFLNRLYPLNKKNYEKIVKTYNRKLDSLLAGIRMEKKELKEKDLERGKYEF